MQSPPRSLKQAAKRVLCAATPDNITTRFERNHLSPKSLFTDDPTLYFPQFQPPAEISTLPRKIRLLLSSQKGRPSRACPFSFLKRTLKPMDPKQNKVTPGKMASFPHSPRPIHIFLAADFSPKFHRHPPDTCGRNPLQFIHLPASKIFALIPLSSSPPLASPPPCVPKLGSFRQFTVSAVAGSQRDRANR